MTRSNQNIKSIVEPRLVTDVVRSARSYQVEVCIIITIIDFISS